MTITYGSVCSGIEAASVAWEPIGLEPQWFAEIEKFPSAVLAHHWTDVPNLGDMTKLSRQVLNGSIEAPDVLVGGTPCQAFSVAGMRKGMDDPRGALTIKYVELADAVDHVRTARGDAECVIVWENVPGVLSDKGNAFGCFLGALAGEGSELQPSGPRWSDAGCVYGPQRAVAWRVLDAQYFGLAQRRRRVFVVASARKGFDPAAVLFEREGMRRDTTPSRETGETITHPIAPCLTGSGRGIERGGDTRGQDPVVAVLPVKWPADIASTLNANFGDKQGLENQHINQGCPLFVPVCVHGTQDPCVAVDKAHALGRNTGQENAVLAFAENSRSEVRLEGGDGAITGTLSTGGGKPGQGMPCISQPSGVRRLTPVECERLQGFPDGHTLIPWRGKPAEDCPDGPRYKAIGNSKAVPVVRWIGQRIKQELSK